MRSITRDKIMVPVLIAAALKTDSPILALHLTRPGIETVDVGVPTFGMHSIRELAGRDDAQSMAKVVTAFFAR